MTVPTFNLIDVLRALQKQKRLIAIVVIISLVLGGLFNGLKKKKYRAEAQFLVNNPIYSDRDNMFRSGDTKYVDYYGGDDELDRVTALASSDTVMDRVIRNSQFQVIYNQDITDPKGHASLMEIFKKNFNIKRSEYRDIEVSYIAYDPQTAANVANMAVQVLESTYRQYYQTVKEDIYSSIDKKLQEVNKAIDSLSDTLANMRDRYKIYMLLSPGRQDIWSGSVKGTEEKGFGKAMEDIQNLESIKDEMVIDRVHYMSNMNEFSASGDQRMSLLKVISRAVPPSMPYGPGTMLTLLISGCLGLLFSVLFVLIMDYYNKIKNVL